MSALDRRLDVFGFVLVALGGFALLGLIAATPGSLTYKLTFLIRQGFGWGAYVVPLVVVALGAWLILRGDYCSMATRVEGQRGLAVLCAQPHRRIPRTRVFAVL